MRPPRQERCKGRVELRADAPDDGEPLRIRLTGGLRTSDGRQRPLELSACGNHCWTGPVDWSAGGNDLVLEVDAGRWQAGRVGIPVTWPAWADGGATDAALVRRDGRRSLLFALPALGYHFTMVLDESNRIVPERIVTLNHLLTRQYRYP